MPVDFLAIRQGTIDSLGKINRHRTFAAKGLIMEPRRFLCVCIIIDPQTDNILLGMGNGRKNLHLIQRNPLHQLLISIQLFQLFLILHIQKGIHINGTAAKIIDRHHLGAVIL